MQQPIHPGDRLTVNVEMEVVGSTEGGHYLVVGDRTGVLWVHAGAVIDHRPGRDSSRPYGLIGTGRSRRPFTPKWEASDA